MRVENRLPSPLITLSAKLTLRLPSTLVFWILRMCVKSLALARTIDYKESQHMPGIKNESYHIASLIDLY